MTRDSVRAAVSGFVELRLRNGWQELVRAADIVSVRPRRAPEHGTVITLGGGRVVLVDVEISEVVQVMGWAESRQTKGANDAKTTR
jgi:hypothetical protein